MGRLAGRVEPYGRSDGGPFRRLELREGRIKSLVLPGFYLRPEWALPATLAPRRECIAELGV